MKQGLCVKMKRILGRKNDDAVFTSWQLENSGLDVLVKELEGKEKRHLNVCNNRFDYMGAETLGRLLQCNTTLVHLNVSRNDIGNAGVAALGRGLKKNSTLQILELSMVGLCGDDGVALLAEMIGGNKGLTFLDLSNNDLGDPGATLVGAVAKNKGIKVLRLTGNGLSNFCVSVIVAGLKVNTTLVSLSLEFDRLEADSLMLLADWLRGDGVMLELKVSLSGVALCKAELLADALQHNTTLRKLCFPRMSDFSRTQCSALLECNGSLLNCGNSFVEVCQRNRMMHVAAKNAALVILAIRRFRKSAFDVLPNELVKIIAQNVLLSKTQVRNWSIEG